MRLAVDDFVFNAARPFWQRSLHGEHMERIRNRWAAFFYVVSQKRGYVCGEASHRPFHDFAVQSQWIMNLYAAEKLTAERTRMLLCQTPGRAEHLVREVDFCEQERIRRQVAELRREAERALASTLLPFRSIPAVEEWQRQYTDHKHRYKFLVLEGPSCTGKTQFAKSLCPSGKRVLELNCASDQEPSMQGFNPIEFGLVLFDEVRPCVIARQRKLFQAGTAEIQLGCSATNVHMYTVCPYRTRLVCCSNDWTESLAELPASSREWVILNSVHVWCNEPLWQEPVDS